MRCDVMIVFGGGGLDNKNTFGGGEGEGFGDFVLPFIDFCHVFTGKYFYFITILNIFNQYIDH